MIDPLVADDRLHVLLLATASNAAQWVPRLAARRDVHVVGVLSDDEDAEGRIGGLGELRDVLRVDVVDRVISLLPMPASRDALARALQTANEFGVEVLAPKSETRILNRHLNGDGKIFGRDDELEIVGLLQRQRGVALRLKSLFDRVMAAVMIVFGLPLFPLIAILIKLDSRGPVIFKQVRVRKGGRHFYLYKFRTMVANAEELKARLEAQNQVDGPAFKIAGDPRITRVGAVLRHFRLDELPQLVNVLKGEMSFVGPRPPLPSEVERYRDWYRRRLSVTPGLTCTWQMVGHDGVTFEEWMRLDLGYIENWSFWTDLRIILGTIPIVVTGSRAM